MYGGSTFGEVRLTTASVESVGKIIDQIRSCSLPRSMLIDLLSERHPVYKERPAYQLNRIRGYAMASFAEVGLPDSALNFILEELQNGRNAYLVGAAARALRGSKKPGAHYVHFLFQALQNMQYHDDSMDLSVFNPTWPLSNPSSAKTEIFLTFQWLKGYARGSLPELRALLERTYDFDSDTKELIHETIEIIEKDDRSLDLSCCDVATNDKESLSLFWNGIRNVRSIGYLLLENQDGIWLRLDQLIDHRPTVVAFFYTRCMNPNKCTLTINKLGWLQKELSACELGGKVNLLALTYDPGYDTPSKMRAFGENRGMNFGPYVQMLRTKPEEFTVISDFFELGVNHVSTTVNQHRLELFLLNQNGNIETSYTRLQWEVERVVNDIKKMMKVTSHFKWLSSISGSVRQVLFPILLALFPKCPICWAVYLSAFGVSGLQSIPYSPWLIPCIMTAMIINLFILFKKSRIRNGLTPFWISLIGGFLVLIPGYLLQNQFTAIIGILLILSGALLNSLPYRQWSKLSLSISSFFKRRKKDISPFKRHQIISKT